MNPESLGIGLGEDTALLIRKGTEAICRGSGMVTIIDGDAITQTNITEAEKDCPVYVENLKVHLLTDNCRFSIEERKLTGTIKRRAQAEA
jgi:cyanophycinase